MPSPYTIMSNLSLQRSLKAICIKQTLDLQFSEKHFCKNCKSLFLEDQNKAI